eukprot:PhF_6_TR34742/c0_g1_i1/m.50563/K03637/moaC, CNX3; cyclic pyranopterin monophosphate synthase
MRASQWLRYSTHIEGSTGLPTMVNISSKTTTHRIAKAQGRLHLPPSIFQWISTNSIANANATNSNNNKDFTCPKGPVLSTAVVAATMAVKNTSNIIPFCHPLSIVSCNFDFEMEQGSIQIICEVGAMYATGVEMEALTGVSVAALTIYDMLKSIPKDSREGLGGMKISDIQVVKKKGGKADFDAQTV